jgi:UDP-N-acetylmuramoyl-L-alanyl-D-glutamate--2,6-diaminopimelate ligase
VDYAHNGLSTRNLLKALRSYHPKRLVCVFGCGGNRDVDRRPEMGKAAGELADLSIITTEHNRFEEFHDILKGIMEGMNSTDGRYEIIEDRKEAIKHAIMDSEPGDLVTILGIGNDGFQHDHGKDIPHDDIGFSRQMVNELLKQKNEH